MGQTLDGVMGKKEQESQVDSSLQERLISEPTNDKNNDNAQVKQNLWQRDCQPQDISKPQQGEISHDKIAEAAERRLQAAQNRGLQVKQPPIQYIQSEEEPETKIAKVEDQPQYSAETIARAAEKRLQAIQNKGMSKQSQIEYELKLAKKEEAERYERERRGQQYYLTYKS